MQKTENRNVKSENGLILNREFSFLGGYLFCQENTLRVSIWTLGFFISVGLDIRAIPERAHAAGLPFFAAEQAGAVFAKKEDWHLKRQALFTPKL